MTETGQDLCLTVAEAAKLIHVSRNQAYALVSEGRLPVIRFSERCIRVPRAALQKMMDEARVSA